MDLPENNCAELSQQTANVIDDDIMHQLFVSTQMNNLDLCVKAALQWGSNSQCHLLHKIDIVQTCSEIWAFKMEFCHYHGFVKISTFLGMHCCQTAHQHRQIQMAIGRQRGRCPSYGMTNTCKVHQEVSNNPMPWKISHAACFRWPMSNWVKHRSVVTTLLAAWSDDDISGYVTLKFELG